MERCLVSVGCWFDTHLFCSAFQQKGVYLPAGATAVGHAMHTHVFGTEWCVVELIFRCCCCWLSLPGTATDYRAFRLFKEGGWGRIGSPRM